MKCFSRLCHIVRRRPRGEPDHVSNVGDLDDVDADGEYPSAHHPSEVNSFDCKDFDGKCPNTNHPSEVDNVDVDNDILINVVCTSKVVINYSFKILIDNAMIK